MRLRTALIAIALMSGLAAPGLASPLPRGNDHFHLGMARSQVDSAIAARRLQVISNGTAFLVCASENPTVEYEQYSFFRAPHGKDYLWKVTIGYRRDASTADYAAAREELRRLLGEPETDSWKAGDDIVPQADARPVVMTQQAIWSDALTAVQIGARWSGSPDPSPDRMMVAWTDRRLQRLVEARRKKSAD